MAEYINREKVLKVLNSIGGCGAEPDSWANGWDKAIDTAISELEKIPAADVRPERHGHIIWRKKHRGGFRTAKCLSDFGNCIFTPTCKHIAKIDERCIIDEPYCSECSKLLGDFLNFCPNCGAKMKIKK